METETKKLLEQESKRSSQKIRAARATGTTPSLSDDDPDEIVTVRAPIATLLGNT